ncbi:MAG: Arylsulfatase [Phycisphaerae bacterium]|nr:Arylsulfatase [Phycisphaerae bacterium]
MSISRRQFIRSMAAGAAGAAGALDLLPRLLAADEGPKRRPNFVIIFTDDQGWEDLGCFGSPLIKTPCIDRMAAEGMKFSDFYVAASVCSPSRAALLTGCYPARIGFDFGALYPGISRGLNPGEITIADLLKKQGYATACVGKWHVGGPHKVYMPTSRGFDSYFGLIASNDYAKTPLYRGLEVVEPKPDQSLLTQRYTDEAVKFIRANKDRPFFLYLPHAMPHVPLAASEKFRGKSKRGLYGDACEEVDWSTGEILKTLKELKLDEHTLVIFTSDNGPWLEKGKDGGSALPWIGGKFKSTEGGQRVPCVMRWPGTIPAGKTCSEVASAMDFYVTFAALAGAKLPDDRVIDGKDILPLLRAEPGAASPYAECGFFYDNKNFKPVRRGKWKYSGVWKDDRLYDLSTPEQEKKDVAKDNPKLVAELKALSEAKWKEMAEHFRPIGDLGKDAKS